MAVKLLCVGKQKNGIEVSEELLNQVVENFSNPVPITLGHPKSDSAPAVGFFERIEVKDGCLYGEYKLSPVGQILLSSGTYKNISVGIRKHPEKGYYLHHVALLGAVPPAGWDAEPLKVVKLSDEGEPLEVEGLTFSQPKEVVKSFAKTDWDVCLDCEWDKNSAVKRILDKGGWELLSKCVGAVIFKEGEKELPQAVSRYKFPFCDVKDGKVVIVAKAVQSGLAFLNGAMGTEVDPELEKVVRPVFEKLKKRIEEVKNMSDELKKKLELLEAKLKEEKIARIKAEAEKKFSENLVKELVEFANSLPVELDFSDPQKETLLDKLAQIIAKIPAPVKESEKGETQKEFSDNFDPNEALNAF
jgi:Skp family chaperone for outer membrane proteins